MDLLLIRHAIAAERDPGLWPDDSERPLTRKGKQRFRQAAHGLAVIAPRVDRLFSSPWRRAWQTAVILQEEAGWPVPEALEQLAGNHGPHDVLAAASQLEPSGVMGLVGHEPVMSELIALMVGADVERDAFLMKKGACALVRFQGAAAAREGRLEWLVQPAAARALRR